jgi:hypothetical protein
MPLSRSQENTVRRVRLLVSSVLAHLLHLNKCSSCLICAFTKPRFVVLVMLVVATTSRPKERSMTCDGDERLPHFQISAKLTCSYCSPFEAQFLSRSRQLVFVLLRPYTNHRHRQSSSLKYTSLLENTKMGDDFFDLGYDLSGLFDTTSLTFDDTDYGNLA